MFGKEKKRPSSADGERPTSSKFVRSCSAESSRQASADDPRSVKSSRPTSPKRRPRKPRAFSTDSSLKTSRDGSPKSLSRCGSASTRASPKSSRPDSPSGSLKSRSSTSLKFKRWGSPYPPTSKNSTRPCSPDYTIVSFEDIGSTFPEQKKQIQTKSPRECPSPEIALKFAGGSNPASKRLMQVMMCAATARAPFLEPKLRKLVFYKNTDKENLVDELQSLKAAVADQAYHFQLHKTHLHGLQIEHKLEETIAALESIDGSNAPRTGGKGRLLSKISGMRIMIGNLTDDITKHQETIQNLMYRYQVCLTREVTIQRDMAAGDVWRLQKQVRNTRDVLMTLTKQNQKFLHLRGKILPDLREALKKKLEKIKAEYLNLMFESVYLLFKEVKLSIKEVEKVSIRFTDDSYLHLRAAEKAKRRASSLLDERKRMRAKLKQERESKRKNQQDVWVIGYETCMFVKENKRVEKMKMIQEAAIAAKVARARAHGQKKA